MSIWTREPITVAAPVTADGTPRGLDMGETQTLLVEMGYAIQALTIGGGKVYATKADMDADLTPAANSSAIVLNDSTASYNGLYRKSGGTGTGSWVRVGDVPGYSFLLANNAGAGTADSIIATTPISLPAADGGALVALPILATNTGPAQVSFNGESYLSILSASLQNMRAGDLKAGTTVWGYRSGVYFKLLSTFDEQFLLATNAGAGTADSIIATTATPVPTEDGAALVALPIVATNTGPAQVSFNGESYLPILSASLQNMRAGDLKAGTTVWGYRSGSYFKLLSTFQEQFILATNSGAGTANAIVATTATPIPTDDAAALIVLPIADTNTAAPVTVAFNGGSALTIQTITGNNPAVGGLVAGSLLIGFKSGSNFRLLSDQASAAIISTAESLLDSMIQRVVGAFASDVAVDSYMSSGGITHVVGALYFNTSSTNWKYWDGSAWQTAGLASGAGLSNVRLAKTGAYSVTNSDKGKTLALGGSAFFTLTVGSAAGFDTDFSIVVINEDSGRGKRISCDGLTSFILWPLQTATIRVQNNIWYVERPSRWKHPGGTFNVYTDYTNGDDSNDGLATGSGNAFKSVQGALYRILSDVEFTSTAGGQTQLVVNMAASTVDQTTVHFSGMFVGQQGGAAVMIKGTTGSEIHTATNEAIGLYCRAIVQIQNVKLTADTGPALSVGLGALAYVMPGVQFGASVVHMSASDPGSHIIINADYQIWGGADEHMLVQNGGAIQSVGSYTATWGANASFTWFALAGTGGRLNVPNMTYNLNSYTCTGKRYEANQLSLIYTGGGGSSYFPGDTAGSVGDGSQYV